MEPIGTNRPGWKGSRRAEGVSRPLVPHSSPAPPQSGPKLNQPLPSCAVRRRESGRICVEDRARADGGVVALFLRHVW